MLSTEDIKNLTDYQLLVFKDVFLTKDEFNGKFSKLQTSVDSFAKESLARSQEMSTVNRRLKDAENWIDKAAPKVGVAFEH